MTKNIATDKLIEAASKVVIGSDPEIFVKDGSGVNISAHDLIPGTKAHPFKVEKGAVQVDGTALEFNIDPAKTSKEFVSHIRIVMKQLQDMVKDKNSLLQFDIKPAVIYGKDLFASIPEEAKELGCEPDYNAYTGSVNPRPDSSLLKGLETMRTGSGHIHIGWTEGVDKMDPAHFEDCRILTRFLDWSLLNASKYWDTDTNRSRLYGAAGAFRPKPYGMEYRVLSNKWLESPELCEFVFEVSKKMTQMLMIYGVGTLRRVLNDSIKNTNPLARVYRDCWFDVLPSPKWLGDKSAMKKDYDYVGVRRHMIDGGRALEEAYNAV